MQSWEYQDLLKRSETRLDWLRHIELGFLGLLDIS